MPMASQPPLVIVLRVIVETAGTSGVDVYGLATAASSRSRDVRGDFHVA